MHILPSYDYASVDESKPDKAQYNWGYDPQNYNVPDGSYSTDPYKPDVRIKEFKQMVQALHKAGIRVVLDVILLRLRKATSSVRYPATSIAKQRMVNRPTAPAAETRLPVTVP